MKRKNFKKLPFGFTPVKSVLTLCLTLTQLALADGINAAKSGARGLAKSSKELKDTAASHDNLNFNKIKVQSNVQMSAELKNQDLVGLYLNDLLEFYRFPNNKALMFDLYNKALMEEGDYTSLQSNQNPFSKFMRYELSGDWVSNSKKRKDFPENEYERVIPSGHRFTLNRKTFSDLPSGLRIKSSLQINPQLSPDGCEACSTADYKPIAKDGISLNVICLVGSIKGDGHILYEYDDNKPLRYTTGVKAHITSQTEKIDIDSPVISSTIVEEIRTKYCHDQDTKEVSVTLQCTLVPSTDTDKAKLLSSFNVGFINLWYSGFTLKNFKNLKGNESMAKDMNPKVSLSHLKDTKRVHHYPILGIDGYYRYETWAYKFPKFEETIIYAQTESELADMVRRFYISGYETLQEKKQDD